MDTPTDSVFSGLSRAQTAVAATYRDGTNDSESNE